MSEKWRFVIIGAGLTGLSATYHLKSQYIVFEKEGVPGGLCRTEKIKGFHFDCSGHLIHLRNEYTKSLVPSLLKNNISEHRRKAYVQYESCKVPFPFQANLSSLPHAVNRECLMEFIDAYCCRKGLKVNSFQDWVVTHLGGGLARHFFVPYNTKLYGADLEHMTSEWCDRYVPKPDLQEMVDGAIGNQKKDFGYNQTFMYPQTGGIQSLVNGFAEGVDNIRLNYQVQKVLWKEKAVIGEDGNRTRYESLVSTMPLPLLVDALEPVPAELLEARKALRWRSVHCLNLGVKGNDTGRYHWAYFPGSDSIFYRVGFIHNFTPKSVPPGCSALYIEIASDPEEVADVEVLFNKAIKDLINLDILPNEDTILVKSYVPMPCAYVVYNHERPGALEVIQRFLSQQSIYSVGRYGDWKYSSMEDAILDGKAIAEQLKG